MIIKCIVCGKEFDGRGNKKVCSGVCRLENKRRYMEKYRELYPEKCKKSWRDSQHKKREEQRKLDININADPKKKIKKEYIPEIFKKSIWGIDYSHCDRLTQISMLSAVLSQYNIAHLSYGYLSAIWDTEKYKSYLNRVLTLKEHEEQNIYEKTRFD